MSGMSQQKAKEILDLILTSSGPVLIALWVGDPGADGLGGGEEVSGGGYGRQYITFDTAVLSTKTSSNNAQVTFPDPTADWGEITHFTLHDSDSNENQIFQGEFDDPFQVLSGGDPVVLEIGDVTVKVD